MIVFTLFSLMGYICIKVLNALSAKLINSFSVRIFFSFLKSLRRNKTGMKPTIVNISQDVTCFELLRKQMTF